MKLDTATSDAPDAAGVYRIWPGAAPGSEDWSWNERTTVVPWSPATGRRLTHNVVVPTLTAFLPPAGKANGTAIVIAPGGAFHFLMVDHEGFDMARWLTARGVTAFVLKYRVARTPDDDAGLIAFRTELQAKLEKPSPTETDPPRRENWKGIRLLAEEDGRQAIRYVRAHAAEWGIDPRRIGIAGFSAGGGVTMGPVFEHDAESRPDFAAPIYPAYRAGLPVPANAPPLFIVISDDDMSIAPISSARLYEAWHKAGIPAELHIFGNGGHGWGMGAGDLLPAPWIDLFGNWLKERGFMPEAKS